MNLLLVAFILGQSDNAIKRGVHVVVHNRSIFPLVSSQGIDIQTGSATNIGVSRTFYENLPSPYSDCRDNLTVINTDSIYYKTTSNVSEKYDHKLCYKIYLLLNVIIPNCKCLDSSILISYLNHTICKTRSELQCVNSWKTSFNQIILTSDCPIECEEIVYTLSLNTASYPTDFYIQILQKIENINKRFKPDNDYPFSPFRPSQPNNSQEVSKTTISPGTQPSVGSGGSGSSGGSGKPNGPGGTSEQTLPKPPSPAAPPISLTNSFAKLSVYYEELRYTYVEETEAMTFDTLIGVIGFSFINL